MIITWHISAVLKETTSEVFGEKMKKEKSVVVNEDEILADRLELLEKAMKSSTKGATQGFLDGFSTGSLTIFPFSHVWTTSQKDKKKDESSSTKKSA